ncbi:MAG: TonB-dependent receptor plug domain-containing protein [Gammaproteobacteria bacterium]|nr:TonB-dependent receptor plug domain-containing protein [Gammaproteobacteria bacterium]MYI77042.1 TonB-dependent receptor plug domain-containing protein [Gammaproteobacteria bacterium]
MRSMIARCGSVARLTLVFIAIMCQSNLSFAQDIDEENQQKPKAISTGSRIAQSIEEVAGRIVILDEEGIRATGEQTLERVLRQVPQNLNPTTERFGSEFNNVINFTSGSTVDLRGLGSESTLVLLDGKPMGHNGILGGVSDVSSIPLVLVERIEILLDSASAIYGSSAVGGVVNIITKKEFEGIEVTADYNAPTTAGYDETRFGIGFSKQYTALNFRFSFQQSVHTALDASDRDGVTIFDPSLFPGPQFDVRFLSDGRAMPIAYESNGEIFTVPEFLAGYSAGHRKTHAILPEGFNANLNINEITNFSEPNWGADAREGYSILPEVSRYGVSLGVLWEVDESWSVDAYFRQEERTVWNNRGYISFHGEVLNGNSPYNPFHTPIHLRGQRRDYPQPFTETHAELVDFAIELKGKISDRITFEASIGQSSEDVLTFRYYEVDRARLSAGMYSDGINPIYRLQLHVNTQAECEAEGGIWGCWVNGIYIPDICGVPGGILPAVNPFGDISQFISNYPYEATSFNRLFHSEALITARLFSVPAGAIRALLGVSRQTREVHSFSEFQIGLAYRSPIDDVTLFNAEVQRTNAAIFAEGVLPLISRRNEQMWAQRLTLHLSFRNDMYDKPVVIYTNSTVEHSSPSQLLKAKSESTLGVGLIWVPTETIKVKYNQQTAFHAPQLNQLLRDSRMGPSPPFQGIWLKQPDGRYKRQPLTVIEGGNPNLSAESADSQSISFTFSPKRFPNLSLNATWNDIQYNNRINRLANFIVDPNNLPSDISYNHETDEYVQERRWINVSSVERNGVDFSVGWIASTVYGNFEASLQHSVVISCDYVLDPKDPENNRVIRVVGETDGSTSVGVVSKHSSNLNLGWYYRGIKLNFYLTTRTSTKTVLKDITREYTPPIWLNLSLNYHFIPNGYFKIPKWFENGRATIVINNVLDRYGETTIINSAGDRMHPTDPSVSPLYGRVLNFSVHFPL